jgi:molybdopterin-guanine dinucleotide biosynthesis protein A
VPAFDPTVITTAILAGGEGRRVGAQDKGLLPLAGRPLIAHVVDALRGQAGFIIICANRNADRYAQFAPVIADAQGGFHGPLAGIAVALAQCRTPWLLTVPVDAPEPPRDLATRLFMAAQSADAAVAHDGECRQPLFALYRCNLANAASAALARDLPVWRWQEEVGTRIVDFSDCPQAFANLNTLDEFHAWESRLHG